MHRVQATFRNGRLELAQPVDWPNGTRDEVIRLPHMVAASTDSAELPNTWPPGYFDQTAGALAGEDFDRPPQGDLPEQDAW